MKLTDIIISLFVLICSHAYGQTQDFVVKGKIGTYGNGKFIKLYYDNDTIKTVDSVRVHKGRYEIKGKLIAPTVGKLTLGTEDEPDYIDVFLSTGTLRVTSKDSLRFAYVRGTGLAEAHEILARQLRPADWKFIDGINTFKKMPEGQEKKTYITTLMAGLEDYTRFKRETVHQFVTAHTNSYVSLYHLDKTARGGLANYETTFPFYEKLSDTLKATRLGEQLGKRLLATKGILTGQRYKDFVSTTPAGDTLSLKDILSKNKYTLLDFWASWCGPCRKENPHVVKTYQAFKDKGFTVFSVSLDNDKEKWTAAIQQDGMPWYHASSLKGWNEPAARLYGVRAIPQNVLIDNRGNIVATNLRAEALFNKIESLLK